MSEQKTDDDHEQLAARVSETLVDGTAVDEAADVDREEKLEQEEEYESEFLGNADVVIIDNGSYTLKVGTADKKAPNDEYRCLVGTTEVDSKEEYIYVDDIEEGKMDDYGLVCPLDKFGRVKDKTQMGNFWNWTLKKYPELDELKVLFTEPSHDLKGMNAAQENREKMMTLIAYGVSAIYIANEAELALYSTGNTSGTVVDMGHSLTWITPVYEGHVLTQAVQMSDISGSTADQFLKENLTNADWTGWSMQKHLHLIKQKHCKVHPDDPAPTLLLDTAEDVEEYKLPDSKQVILLKKKVLAQTPGIYFDQFLLKNPESNIPGQRLRQPIHIHIENAVSNTPAKIRQNVNNVILCGGSSLFTGMVERLNYTISEYVNKENKGNVDTPELKLVASPYRKYATWIGGSILANLEPFKDKWITKAILDEEGGDRCVHKMIFW